MQPGQLDQIQQAPARSAADLTTPAGSSDDVPLGRRLEQLTRTALGSVPGADYVELTMRTRQGGPESHAPTVPELAELDRLQVSLEEGPCLDAIAVGTSSVIEVSDFAEETGAGRGSPRPLRTRASPCTAHARSSTCRTPCRAGT